MSHAASILAILAREAQLRAAREARHPELYAALRRSHLLELRSAALIEQGEAIAARARP